MTSAKTWRMRLRERWRDYQWLIFGAVAFSTLFLGFRGFSIYFHSANETRTFLDIIYLTLQLMTLESGSLAGPLPWQLETARLLAPAVAAFAVVKAVLLIFKEQIQQIRLGSLTRHVVICGLGRKGSLLVQKFRELGHRVVVIELDEGNDFLGQAGEQGAIVLVGNAAGSELLRKARVHRAAYLIAVCGNDGTNAEIAVSTRALCADQGRKRLLNCIVHVVDPQLCRLLEEQEIKTGQRDSFRLEFFNVFEKGARLWMREYPPHKDTAGGRISEPHLLVVGVGRLGENLIVQAVRTWILQGYGSEATIGITIIDRRAEELVELLKARYPLVKNKSRLIALPMDINSSAFQAARFLSDETKGCRFTHIFVCLDDDSFGLATALTLYRRAKGFRVAIAVRMIRDAGLASLLTGGNHEEGAQASLQSFGLLDRTCQPEQVLLGTTEILAKAIHKDYQDRHRKRGETSETNPALVDWKELPELLRESNRRQADHIWEKLRLMGYDLEELDEWDVATPEFKTGEIEQMARMEHERWLHELHRPGDKKLPKKFRKKKSAALVPWDDLEDEDIKEENRAPVRNLPRYLSLAGYKVVARDEFNRT